MGYSEKDIQIADRFVEWINAKLNGTAENNTKLLKILHCIAFDASPEDVSYIFPMVEKLRAEFIAASRVDDFYVNFRVVSALEALFVLAEELEDTRDFLPFEAIFWKLLRDLGLPKVRFSDDFEDELLIEPYAQAYIKRIIQTWTQRKFLADGTGSPLPIRVVQPFLVPDQRTISLKEQLETYKEYVFCDAKYY